MAVFETLYLLFKADSTQLKKEVDDVKKKTNEATGSFKEIESQTKKTDNQFVNLAKSLAGVATAYFSVGSIISSFQASVAKTTGLSDFARDTGVAIEVVSAFGTAFKNFGVEASEFQGVIDSIFNTFGGRVRKSTIADYIPTLSNRLKELEAFETGRGRNYAEETLGISPAGTSALLGIETSILTAATKATTGRGITTAEEAKRVTDFNTATSKLSTAFDDLSKIMVDEALPTLTKLVELITELINIFIPWREERQKELRETPGTLQNLGSFLYKNKKVPENKKEGVFKPGISGIVDDPNADTTQINLGNTGDFQRDHRGTDLSIGPQSFYIPPVIPQISNSQATSLAFNGDVHVNTTAQDARGIADSIMTELGSKGKTLLSQLQQSNSYFDNSVVV